MLVSTCSMRLRTAAGVKFRSRVFEAADQPHQFDIAAGLRLQASAGGDLVQVAVQVELQQRRGVIARSAGHGGRHAGKAEGCEIQFVDKRIDDAGRVILGDVIVQAIRK